MIQTKRSNSFETMSFRALIAISFLCVIFGSGTAFFQHYELKFLQGNIHQFMTENDKRSTPEFDHCLNQAFENEDDNRSMIQRCYELYTPDKVELNKLFEERDNASRWVSIGLVTLITPIPLFTIYFILRWIITGRWKQAKD